MPDRILILDMDGVILDSEPLHQNAREMMYQKYGIRKDENLPDPVGKSSSGFWEMIREKNGRFWDSNRMEEEQYFLVAEQVRDRNVSPSEGLPELLDWCKCNGWKIGLASSSSCVLIDRILKLLHLKESFDVTVAGDEVENKKPAPDVYERVLSLSGIDRKNAIAIEDSSTGIKAANQAGIYCYGYQNETSGKQDLSMADKVIDHISEAMEDISKCWKN